MNKKGIFIPKEIFPRILEWSVIPTFDLLIEYGSQGFIFVKRSIAPYKNVWALPGLRMMKGEEIDDTLQRIAKNELGLTIDISQKKLLGQFVGKFSTEHNRQDLSTGYYIKISGQQEISFNKDHFSSIKITKKIPAPTGVMYRYFFERNKKVFV